MRYPAHLEAQYSAQLRRRVAAITANVRAMHRPTAAQLRELQAGWTRAHPFTEDNVLELAVALDRTITASVVRAINRAGGIADPKDLRLAALSAPVAAWVEEQVRAVRAREADLWSALTEAALEVAASPKADAWRQDAGGANLLLTSKASLLRTLQGTSSAAANSARVGVSQLTGAVNAARQQALGVGSYTWTSQRDNRVRPAHVKLDGTVREWSNPDPNEGHPGDAFGCRCVAVPVIVQIPAKPPPPKVKTGSRRQATPGTAPTSQGGSLVGGTSTSGASTGSRRRTSQPVDPNASLVAGGRRQPSAPVLPGTTGSGTLVGDGED